MKTILVKKFFVAVLTTVMTIGTLSGCGKGGGRSGTGRRTEGMTYQGQDVSEPLELNMYLIGDKAADFDKVYEKVNEILKQKVNATLNVKYLPWGEFDTKYSLIFSSGEDFDLIFTASGWGHYEETVAKSGFYEMDEKFRKTYAPDIQKLLPEVAWEQAEIDKKVYMVPNYQHEYGMEMVGVRGDLMEKYHYDDITTPEELESFLWDVAKGETAIKPLGSRNGADLVRYFLFPDRYPLIGGTFTSIFTYNLNDNDDSSIVYTIDTDAFMDYAKKMREFYQAGFWTADTLSSEEIQSDSWVQGKAAIMSWNLGNVCGRAREMNAAHPEWRATFVDPLRTSKKQFNAYINNGVGINAGSKHPERAMMVINELMTDKEVYDLTCYGIEGVHWEEAGENTYKSLPASENFPPNGTCNWGWMNLELMRTEYVEEKDEVYEKQRKTIEEWDRQNAIPHPYVTFSFDNQKVKTEVTNITSVLEKEFDPICAGLVDDPEKAVKDLREHLNTAGIQKVYAELQKQAEEFWASKQ